MWIAGILLTALWASQGLDIHLNELVPDGSGSQIMGRFLSAALHPAFDYESAVPAGTVPLLSKVLDAVRRTLVFAAAGMSLSLLIGLPLGALASTSWWEDSEDTSTGLAKLTNRVGRSGLFVALRAVIAVMRSIHELLWAILFLAALGLNSFSAVCAIAIPYGGTLAKVFSEMLDETPRDTADVLRGSGASKLQVFLFGLLPRALPDMAAYTFYRLECAVRSSAMLGFFGFPTLGYFIKLAFVNQHYREVWTYLWALILVVVALELVSGALRRRVVIR